MDFCAESVTLLDCVLLQFYFTLNTIMGGIPIIVDIGRNIRSHIKGK